MVRLRAKISVATVGLGLWRGIGAGAPRNCLPFVADDTQAERKADKRFLVWQSDHCSFFQLARHGELKAASDLGSGLVFVFIKGMILE